MTICWTNPDEWKGGDHNDDYGAAHNKMPLKLGEFIVKVQVSLFPNTGQVLIYDEGKNRVWQGAVTPQIRSMMNGKPKGFFVAIMRGTEMHLQRVAPRQDYRW